MLLENHAQNQSDDRQAALFEQNRRLARQRTVEGDEDDVAHEAHDGDFAHEDQGRQQN